MSNGKLSGFTLIELLVVVAIIAVLVAILLPALNNARQQAQMVVCSSHLKQLGMGWIYYADDNDGTFPMGLSWTRYEYWWMYNKGIGRYMPTPTISGNGAPPDKQPDINSVYKGWWCPKHPEAVGKTIVGYQFNTFIGFNRWTRRTKISFPSKTPLLFCYWDITRPDLPLGNYFSCPSYNETHYLAWHFMYGASNVHGSGTNFLLADGHVERIAPHPSRFDYQDLFYWRP